MSQIAKLALEDGTVYTGEAFGAVGEVDGEVCFNTSMPGYQEILTDPSYRGQIVCMTYTEIGNYGVNADDVESQKPHLAGLEQHDELDGEIVSAIREYWQDVHQDRRKEEGQFSISANRLAEHDAENFISVLGDRETQRGKSPLGYTTWLFTLDSKARKMLQVIDRDVRDKIKHLPIISLDFLLKYLAFGPARDRITQEAQRMPYVFGDPEMEVPTELLAIASATRTESQNLPERIVQRRIRDAMDRERMKLGPVQLAGLDGSSTAIESMFK